MRILKYNNTENYICDCLMIHFNLYNTPYLVIEVEAYDRRNDIYRENGDGRMAVYYEDWKQERFRRKYYSASLLDKGFDYSKFLEISEESDEWIEFYNKFILDKAKNCLVYP